MMQLTKSGESGGMGGWEGAGGGVRKKRDPPAEPQGTPKCGKCALCLFILLQRARFPGSVGVKHTRLAVTSDLWLA